MENLKSSSSPKKVSTLFKFIGMAYIAMTALGCHTDIYKGKNAPKPIIQKEKKETRNEVNTTFRMTSSMEIREKARKIVEIEQALKRLKKEREAMGLGSEKILDLESKREKIRSSLIDAFA